MADTPTTSSRLPWLVGGAALMVGVGVLWTTSPTDFPPFMPRCLFHQVSGLHCPGCGGTRAAHHLLNGEFQLAFRHHALLVLGLPFAFVIGVGWLLSVRIRHAWQRVLQKPAVWIVLFTVLILFGIVRNLPVEWAQPLAPPPPQP